MTVRLESSADIGYNGIKMMIYGGWGVGKTPCLATAPGIVVISAEQGLLSIRKVNPPVPVIQVRNYAELTDAYNWMAGSNEARQFYTFGLDSFSEIVEVLLQQKKLGMKDPRKAFYEVNEDAVKFARAVRDLPGRHVVLLCKEAMDKDTAAWVPDVPGNKLGPQLPYYFDEVFRQIVVNDPQRGRMAALCTSKFNPLYQGRDRSGMLDEFEPTNLTHVFNKILSPQRQLGA